MVMGLEDIAGKLLDVLRREESAILSGSWEKLAPLDRLRRRLWKILGPEPGQGISQKRVVELRDQCDKNTRLLTNALAEVGEKLMVARRRSQASAAYGRT